MEQIALTADEIFAAKDLDHREFVALPEWGIVETTAPDGKVTKTPKGVFVRVLSIAERGKIRKDCTVTLGDRRSTGGTRDVVDAEKFECALTVECSVDSNGRRIFKPTDGEALMSKRSGSVSKIAAVAMRLAGLDPKSEDPVEDFR